MGNFNRDSRGGGRSFDRPRFGGGRDFSPRSDRPLFKTVCSNCGKDCEVPFRPTNGKPVYCKECFGNKRNSDRGDERPRRNESIERLQSKPHFDGGKGNDDVKKQLEGIHNKLDHLMHSVDALTQKKPSQRKEKTSNSQEDLSKKVIKKIVKKSSKKAKK